MMMVIWWPKENGTSTCRLAKDKQAWAFHCFPFLCVSVVCTPCTYQSSFIVRAVYYPFQSAGLCSLGSVRVIHYWIENCTDHAKCIRMDCRLRAINKKSIIEVHLSSIDIGNMWTSVWGSLLCWKFNLKVVSIPSVTLKLILTYISISLLTWTILDA